MNSIKYYISILFFAFATNIIFGQEKANHTIKVLHPGISLTDSITVTLVEILDGNQSKEFFMDVETVVCGDAQCKVDVIQVYWNRFGEFKHYELPLNVSLEKDKGEHFDYLDYQKLNTILSNPNSSLKDVFKYEVVSNSNGEGVDAYSGETVLLEKSSYVKGAVWTCYTLWHWVHGTAKKHVRNITGDKLSQEDLLTLLKSKSQLEQIFALEQLSRQKKYSEKAMKNVTLELLAQPSLAKKGIEYLLGAELTQFQKATLYLISHEKTKARLLYVSAINYAKFNFDETYLKKILEAILKSVSYEEINLFLTIADKNNLANPSVNEQLLGLLDEKKIIISRRVYWFLKEQILSNVQQLKLEKFYNQHQDKL